MTRTSIALITGLIAASMTGCLDRGGLGSNDAGGGPLDAGNATGGNTGSQTGGTGTPGTGGSPGSGGASQTGGATVGTGGESATGGAAGSGGVSGTGGRKGMAGNTGTGGKEMCGPVCAIYCGAYGNVLDAKGCPTCACMPKPVVCPTIACLVACPNGNTTDPTTGCSTCACKPQPVCPALPCRVCPNGYVVDPATGCSTCTCLPDPKACAVNDCGPQPVEPVTLLCPGTGVPSGGPAPPMGATAPIAAPPPGPYTCEQTSAGKCLWHKSTCVVCSAVTCKIYCANGFKAGADGCPTCACNPPTPPPISDCAGYADRGTCAADPLCTWLQPGCVEPALAAAGCYARSDLGCTSDAECGQGHQCLKRVVNPCPPSGGLGSIACTACGLVQTICQ